MSNGRCVRCACVNAGRTCTDCRPSRTNPQRCENLATANDSGSSIDHSTDALVSQQDEPNRSQDSNLPPIAFDHLPVFEPTSAANFQWGASDGFAVTLAIDRAYAEIVHWRRNVFLLPSGKVGREFVRELSRLFTAYAERQPIELIAMKAAMTMPALLLQKPDIKSKARDHVKCLERRLQQWSSGDIDELLREGRTIQQHLPQSDLKDHTWEERKTRAFAKLMFEGKVRAALRLLSDQVSSGILSLDQELDGTSVRDILKDKHPPAQSAHPSTLLPPSACTTEYHPVMFETVNGDLIRSVALQVHGSAGPSGVDAAGWRRMCTAFQGASTDLCDALAAMTKRISTEYVDPSGLTAFTASRLVPLDKQPGVRPIGISEIARRIISKAILRVTKSDIQSAVGSLQLCAGQDAGVEAAVHAMRMIFESESTDGVILVDASNAFNCLNRAATLHNVQILCPCLAPALTNIYRKNAELFVAGETILSQEGTTQGDPLAMAMYALGVTPLIQAVSIPDTQQLWFADDATAGGRLHPLRTWWDKLADVGPAYGYHVNNSKTWLVVKAEHLSEAERIFDGTGVRVTCTGKRHLGAALGTGTFIKEYVQEKVVMWKAELDKLASIAKSEPHAAFAAFTHGLIGHWMYFLRTIEGTAPLLQPLEDSIRQHFLPALTGQSGVSDLERELLALPARHGGLGLVNPTTMSEEHTLSRRLTAPLTAIIILQRDDIGDSRQQQQSIKSSLRTERRKRQEEAAAELKTRLPQHLQRAAELASEKGAYSWVTALPFAAHGFALHKSAFRDALCLRYNWTPADLPRVCVCGAVFTTDHALSCPTGGVTIIRHNEVRDLTASLLTEVCHDVCIEPRLQPLSGETLSTRNATTEDNARLDVAASGFWGGRFERAFFDVRVFNPYAPSNRTLQTATCYRRHEREKRRKYEERIREVEHASFVPLVLSCTGGAGPCATNFLQRLAALQAEKHHSTYSMVMELLRCRLSFALLRSAITCLRSARSSFHRPGRIDMSAVDLAMSEGRVERD